MIRSAEASVGSAPAALRPTQTDPADRRPILVAIRAFGGLNPSLEWAARRAAVTNTPLVLVHAVPSALLMPPDVDYSDVVAGGRLALRTEAARYVTKFPQLRVSTYLHCGDVVHALVGLSADAQLLVVGADRMESVTGVFRGAIAIEIVLASAAPVLVIPTGHRESGARNGSRQGHVVVGVDGSAEAFLALHRAAREAGRLGAALRVITAVRPEAPLHDAVTRSIADGVLGIRRAYPTLVVSLILDEARTPERALLRHSKDAALLVIARHGRGAGSGMALGSVTHSLLLLPPCPTLVMA
jgi:nucleotide-binding universal stress UspA family protein